MVAQAVHAMIFVADYMNDAAVSEAAALAAMNIALSNAEFAGEITTDILNKVSKTLQIPMLVTNASRSTNIYQRILLKVNMYHYLMAKTLMDGRVLWAIHSQELR